MKEGKRWFAVAAYAVAMAWVEAAVVYYLRTMLGRIEPHQPDPLPMAGSLGSVEPVRELATLVMLFMVGALAGRSWRSRLGYTCIAFGIWDIFYYVFLKLMCGWPHSLLDWDILFLIPLPWWGPVLVPMIIAVLMIVWGTLASQFDREIPPLRHGWRTIVTGFLGAILALYVFMSDALRVIGQGTEAVRNVLPVDFAWGWFAVATVMMSIPVFDVAWKVSRRQMSSLRPDPNMSAGSETIQSRFANSFCGKSGHF